MKLAGAYLQGVISGILFVALVLLLTGCGYEDWRETDCFNGCVPPEDYTDDGTSEPRIVTVAGPQGPAGGVGPSGPGGRTGDTGGVGPAGRDGTDGTTGPAGADGLPGANGDQGETGAVGPIGPAGANGENGSSCSATQAIGGVLISCTDGTSAVLLDGPTGPRGDTGEKGDSGSNGVDGLNAPPTPYTVTEMIDPCGDQTAYDEILMRLANDQLVAHFSSGSLEFLTVIPPGNYVTTDGTHCHFTVDIDMQITNEYN